MASIRIAEVRDAAAIAHVHVQSWLTTYAAIVPQQYLDSLNEAERIPVWQDWLKRDILVFVAEVEGKVAGFASGGAIREPDPAYDSELYALYLLKEVQEGSSRRGREGARSERPQKHAGLGTRTEPRGPLLRESGRSIPEEQAD